MLPLANLATMLSSIHLTNVGPASRLDLELSQRLTVLTGDNGLGKSFLLDVAWWLLTGEFAREKIASSLDGGKAQVVVNGLISELEYLRRRREWVVQPGERLYSPNCQILVLYAQVDGGVSVWDPAKYQAPQTGHGSFEVPVRAGSRFAASEVWTGNRHCEGLYRDWVKWQLGGLPIFQVFCKVLSRLSPEHPLTPGLPRRIELGDPLEYPTLKLGLEEVPLPYVSAGMRRIIALAYILVWAWQEHQESSRLTGSPVASNLVLLVDEIESHLHPKWQRLILPALMEVGSDLPGSPLQVQLMTTTHSPLVLTSLEPNFDPSLDSIWEFSPGTEGVRLENYIWHRQGDANGWLTTIFNLDEPRSVEAERAMTAALDILRKKEVSKAEIEEVNAELGRCLSELDPFWLRWSAFREQHQ